MLGRRHFALLTVLVVGVALLVAPGALARGGKAHEVEVQVLAFNDFHGNLKPPAGSAGQIRTSNSPIVNVDAGGVEYFATHVAALEATNPQNTIVTSSGDLIGASPLLSGLFHDEPTIEAMNFLGLDINGVGNHEFDEGRAELLRMRDGGCHPVDGCQDGTPFAGSVFDFLAANVLDDSTHNPLLPPFKIVKLKTNGNGNDGQQGTSKIAFIGETLEGTPQIVTPAGVQGLTFLDEADTVNMLVPRLRKMGVEAIVVLLHEGGFQTAPFLYDGCNGLNGAIVDIVNRMDDEVDVVASAHTHQPYLCTIDGKLVTSAASFGRLITDIDLTIDTKTDDVVAKTARNVIVTRDVPKSGPMTSLIDHYDAIAGPIESRVVGEASADLTTTPNVTGESSLGDIIADAQLAATESEDFGGAKVAFMNPGGIRANIAAGEVTYGELFTVQPFANTLTVKTCTGAQLDALLEQQFQVNRTLQISAGFTYSYSASAPVGSKVDPSSIEIDSVTVAPATGYRVTMNNFLATGGDGFTVFNSCTDQLGGEVDLDALVRYFEDNSPIAPGPQDRIIRLP